MVQQPLDYVPNEVIDEVLIDGHTEMDLRNIALKWYNKDRVDDMSKDDLIEFYRIGI